MTKNLSDYNVAFSMNVLFLFFIIIIIVIYRINVEVGF